MPQVSVHVSSCSVVVFDVCCVCRSKSSSEGEQVREKDHETTKSLRQYNKTGELQQPAALLSFWLPNRVRRGQVKLRAAHTREIEVERPSRKRLEFCALRPVLQIWPPTHHCEEEVNEREVQNDEDFQNLPGPPCIVVDKSNWVDGTRYYVDPSILGGDGEHLHERLKNTAGSNAAKRQTRVQKESRKWTMSAAGEANGLTAATTD